MVKKVSDAELDIDQMSGFFQRSPEMKEQISQLDLRLLLLPASTHTSDCKSCGRHCDHDLFEECEANLEEGVNGGSLVLSQSV